MSPTVARSSITILLIGAVACVLIAATVDERRELEVIAIPAELDLGRVDPKTSHPCVVTLKNIGRAVAHIREIRTTCGCTVAETSQRVVAPHAKSSVKVTEEVGTVVRTVYVEVANERGALASIVAIPIRLTVHRPQ